jgi:hypothetical protein
MNLLEIILQYLEKCETDSQATGDAFLADLVKGAGMSKSLVKHIKGCWPNGTVKHLGSFLTHKDGTGKLQDVNSWSVQVKA